MKGTSSPHFPAVKQIGFVPEMFGAPKQAPNTAREKNVLSGSACAEGPAHPKKFAHSCYKLLKKRLVIPNKRQQFDTKLNPIAVRNGTNDVHTFVYFRVKFRF